MNNAIVGYKVERASYFPQERKFLTLQPDDEWVPDPLSREVDSLSYGPAVLELDFTAFSALGDGPKKTFQKDAHIGRLVT